MINLGIKTLTGAKILIDTLKNQGVDTIFGYPGGIVLEVYDELYKQNSIKHILCGHEQACIHAAEGYSRTSGKCGVVLVTSGPGATNLITGFANAYLDGYPLIVLTGQVNEKLIGKDAFQEVNIIDITKSCTKKNFQVTNVNNLEETIIKAFEVANSGKKGPVLIDLAKNIFSESCDFKGLNPYYDNKNSSKIENIKNLKYLLEKSKKPLIISGGGVKHSNSAIELMKFAEKNQIPIVSTMMSLDCFDYDNPLFFGMIGIFGSPVANQLIRESDLIISFGARLNDRITCCYKNGELENKIIQVDINSEQFGKFFNPIIAINADIKDVLTNLKIDNNYTNWFNSIRYLKDTVAEIPQISDKLSSEFVVNEIWDYTKNLKIPVTTEVGQHQLWCAKGYKFNYSGQFITSGGLGTMGFGFPAAIGASIARGSSPVICFAGDGSLQMNLQELATCVNYNLPVKIMLMNNGYLGMVRQLQEKNCEGRYSETKIQNPDFIRLCASYGIEALRVETEEQIKPALERCFSSDKPFLIDFIIEPMELV